MFDFLSQGQGQQMPRGNPLSGPLMPMPTSASPLGSAPMNQQPQQPGAQPGNPPLNGFLSLLGGLGQQGGGGMGQGGGLNGFQSILSGLGMNAQPSFLAGLMGKGGLF